MGNKEAIRDIKEHIKVDCNGNIVLVGEISPVTIDMAIEALKNQEAEKERIIKELEEIKEILIDCEGRAHVCFPKYKAIDIVRGSKE